MIETGDRGVVHQLHVGFDARVEREQDVLAVAGDAGHDVEFRARVDFGRLATGDEGGGGDVLSDGLRDRVGLVIVLDFAVADGGRAIIDHGKPRCAQSLALAGLFERADVAVRMSWLKMFVNVY